MRHIYRFSADCGRNGCLSGVFVADHEDVAKLIGRTVYFGEVLGKHSDVSVEIDAGAIKVISDAEITSAFVDTFERVIGSQGLNPLDYLDGDA